MRIFYLLVLGQFMFGATINVPSDYSTIQGGIDAASNGDTVLVDTGRYVGGIDLKGKGITLSSKMLLNGDESYIASTIIDGMVEIITSEDSSTVFKGFTIENDNNRCLTTDDSHPILSDLIIQNCANGGMYINGGNMTLQNIIIQNNTISTYYGGGIMIISDSNVTLVNCKILSNTAEGPNFGGGGIFLEDSSCILDNCQIDEFDQKR